MANVVGVDNLNTSTNGGFCKVFKVHMVDATTLLEPATPVVLPTGLVRCSTATAGATTGKRLEGFEPDNAHGNSRVGFVPNADIVRVWALTDATDPAAAYVTFDRASFIKDTSDTTNQSMKIDLYTSAKVFAVIIEIPV